MWTEVFDNSSVMFRLTLSIASIGIIISGLEWLSCYPLFKNDHIFSWTVRKIRTQTFIKNKLYDRIYSYPNVMVLIVAQVIGAVILLLFNELRVILLLGSGVIALATIIFSLRAYAGYTGADQMLKIIFITGFLSYLAGTQLALTIGMLFISGQLIIAYGTPGILRLFEKEWKNGNQLLLIARQHTYGNRMVYGFLKKYKLARLFGAWSIMFFEFGAVFALCLPLNYLLIYLLFGVFFHLTNAFVMGLNTFTWAFVATYPAFIWVSLFLRDLL